MNHEQSRPEAVDDLDVAALLQSVGPRPAASSAAMADVRAAVTAAWRDTVTARRRRRQFVGWAAAASVAVTAFGVWLARPLLQPEPVVVASLERVVGGIEQNRGDGRWTPLAGSAALESGTQLRTAADGRAALQLANGMQLRLDSRTLVTLDDAGHATLATGAVYVDSGRPSGGPGPEFELETPAGRVTHLGTQYEARIGDGTLSVGVREGRVKLTRATGEVVGTAGEQLVVVGDEVRRAPLAPNATDWQWVSSVTPPFDIEGRSVEDFLMWAARETGRTIVYTSSEAASEARGVTLRGTVQGLTPDEAVQAVLATTSLQPDIGTEHIRVHGTGP